MDIITGMRTFCAVAQQKSFVNAASLLGISPALTSKYIGQLEDRLGVRLLNRTTRSLSLTEQGSRYFNRCQELIAQFDALEASVQEAQTAPKGHLRLSAPRALGEAFLMPVISDFLDEYPNITVEVHLSDRFVNIVEEGFDLAVRVGVLQDSALVARKLSSLNIVLCAAPEYLEWAGTPHTPEDLSQHRCIIDSIFKGGATWPFWVNGKKTTVVVSGRATVNSANACRDMALRGVGIIRAPDHVVAEDIAAGRLKPLLNSFVHSDFGIYAIYPHSQYLATKTRLLVDFLVMRFSDQGELVAPNA
ncbi:MAG: LysR family transcriptional regulator [Rhodobacteraceae bacterium]|nr:LysR family transcriptional regulator [Paracoccaceae bacterium]